VFSVLRENKKLSAERKRNSGLTLLELMIVIAIISILASIAIPNYFDSLNKARYVTAISDLHQISTAIDYYYLENGVYPNNLGVIGMAINDPWGRPYQYSIVVFPPGRPSYRQDGRLRPVSTDYDLCSMGADGRSQRNFMAHFSRDDIVRANNGAYWGYAKDY